MWKTFSIEQTCVTCGPHFNLSLFSLKKKFVQYKLLKHILLVVYMVFTFTVSQTFICIIFVLFVHVYGNLSLQTEFSINIIPFQDLSTVEIESNVNENDGNNVKYN